MSRIIVLSVIFSLFLLCATLHAQPADSAWPMFRHDAQHTGLGNSAGCLTGTLAWSQVTGWPFVSSPAIGPGGNLYLGGTDGNFYSFDSTGGTRWSYNGASAITSSPAIDSAGRNYFGSDDGLMFALTSVGALSWSYQNRGGHPIESSPAISPEGRVYMGGGNSYLVYGLNSSGSLGWSYRTGERVHSSPGIDSDGQVYVGSADNNIYALASTGTFVWSYNLGAAIYQSSPAIRSDGRIHVGSGVDPWDPIGNILSFNRPGTLSWSYQAGGDIRSSPALGIDGSVYVGSGDNNIYALTSSGKLEWSYMTGEDVFSSPAIALPIPTPTPGIVCTSDRLAYSDWLVYVGSGDNTFYAINQVGGLTWSYRAGAQVESSPAIGADGKVYVGAWDNSFYCFQDPTPTPTPTHIPNYVDLRVQLNGCLGYDFYPGQNVALNWATHEDMYNYRNVPCAVYLAAAMEPLKEDTAVTVQEIVKSGALFIFDSKMRPVLYNPRTLKPTFSGVRFPVPGLGSSGQLSFKVPEGAPGRWVFAAAFIRLDNKQFPAQPPVEVSNGFNLH